LAATLVFLEKLTLRPGEIERADAEAVRAAGVSEQALRDATTVCALFSMIVRLADSLGWDVPDWEAFRLRAPAMLEGGYAPQAVAAR
jgi:alkylhydroperoxidase family enzyme